MQQPPLSSRLRKTRAQGTIITAPHHTSTSGAPFPSAQMSPGRRANCSLWPQEVRGGRDGVVQHLPEQRELGTRHGDVKCAEHRGSAGALQKHNPQAPPAAQPALGTGTSPGEGAHWARSRPSQARMQEGAGAPVALALGKPQNHQKHQRGDHAQASQQQGVSGRGGLGVQKHALGMWWQQFHAPSSLARPRPSCAASGAPQQSAT